MLASEALQEPVEEEDDDGGSRLSTPFFIAGAATVAFGVFLYLIGSFQLSHITLDTSSTDLIVPLAITGVAFACLFVPLTTAALSSMPRHQLAEAAGLNSFLRQIGGSVGLTISTTVFTRYASEASSALAAQVSVLRPEVAERLAATKAGLMAHGFDAVQAGAIAIRSVQGKVTTNAARTTTVPPRTALAVPA